jgi:hypothetical protein
MTVGNNELFQMENTLIEIGKDIKKYFFYCSSNLLI